VADSIECIVCGHLAALHYSSGDKYRPRFGCVSCLTGGVSSCFLSREGVEFLHEAGAVIVVFSS
jgi:hypothetical protein